MDFYKSLRCFVSIIFLFNLIPVDNSYSYVLSGGHGKAVNLSPPLACDDLMGIQHKDICQIEFALESHIRQFNEYSRSRDKVDFGQMINKLQDFFRVETTDSVFAPADIQFMYNEAVYGDNNIYVRCRVADEIRKPRNYYVLFEQKEVPMGIQFSVSAVNTEAEFLASKKRPENILPRKARDRRAIERYRDENEFLIDSFIKERILSGDFAEIKGRRQQSDLDWDRKYPGAVGASEKHLWPEGLMHLLGYFKGKEMALNIFFSFTGKGVLDLLKNRNLVFIRVPQAVGFPRARVIINEKDRMADQGKRIEVEVRSHASDNAVYIFLEDYLFDDFYQQEARDQGNAGFNEETLTKDIIPYLIHEIGVIHGLNSFVKKDAPGHYRVVNELDQLFKSYLGYIKK
jgi:hypothetical protein